MIWLSNALFISTHDINIFRRLIKYAPEGKVPVGPFDDLIQCIAEQPLALKSHTFCNVMLNIDKLADTVSNTLY